MEKRIELENYANLHGYKIIAITESWATSKISDSELSLDGFVLFRKDRCDVKPGKGGGVLLYVSNGWVSSCLTAHQHKVGYLVPL